MIAIEERPFKVSIANNPEEAASRKKFVCFRPDVLIDNYELLLEDNATRQLP